MLVQDAATGEPASEVQVTIKAARRGSPGVTISHPATTEAATNKLYYAATFDLPEPGWYSLEVSIDGALGEAQVRLRAGSRRTAAAMANHVAVGRLAGPGDIAL